MTDEPTTEGDHADLDPGRESHEAGAAMSDADRYVVACHEAGHAVAAVMRGGKCCHITIERDDDYDGVTNVVVAQRNMAFITFAGPWAEARAMWTARSDGEDDDDGGLTFEDHLALACERNAEGDVHEYRRFMKSLAAVYGDLNALLTYESEQVWSRELQGKWPVIQRLAQILVDEVGVSAEVVAGLLE